MNGPNGSSLVAHSFKKITVFYFQLVFLPPVCQWCIVLHLAAAFWWLAFLPITIPSKAVWMKNCHNYELTMHCSWHTPMLSWQIACSSALMSAMGQSESMAQRRYKLLTYSTAPYIGFLLWSSMGLLIFLAGANLRRPKGACQGLRRRYWVSALPLPQISSDYPLLTHSWQASFPTPLSPSPHNLSSPPTYWYWWWLVALMVPMHNHQPTTHQSLHVPILQCQWPGPSIDRT